MKITDDDEKILLALQEVSNILQKAEAVVDAGMPMFIHLMDIVRKFLPPFASLLEEAELMRTDRFISIYQRLCEQVEDRETAIALLELYIDYNDPIEQVFAKTLKDALRQMEVRRQQKPDTGNLLELLGKSRAAASKGTFGGGKK